MRDVGVTLVEDDPDCAEARLAELGARGYRCWWLGTARAAVDAAARRELGGIVLMDLCLPRESAFEAIATIHGNMPETAIVALTGHAASGLIFRAFRAGAVGYLLKSDALGRLAAVVHEVATGGSPLSPPIACRLVATLHQPPRPRSDGAKGDLTARERDVLQLFAKGLSYAETGQQLGIALDTVRAHVRKVYDKLHALTKAEAVALGLRSGWLE